MTAAIARPLAAVAALGCALSIFGSVANLAGVQTPDWIILALASVALPLGIVAVVLVYGAEPHRAVAVQAVTERSPAWSRHVQWGISAFAVVLFAIPEVWKSADFLPDQAKGFAVVAALYAFLLRIMVTLAGYAPNQSPQVGKSE